MYKKTIEYTDYNGLKRKEDFFFNIKKSELIEMQFGRTGGFNEYLERITQTQDLPEVIKVLKEIIKLSYGVKSDDGTRFIKKAPDGHSLADDFEQTEAFSELYMELATNADAAAKFVNSVFPQDLDKILKSTGDAPKLTEVTKAS